jgi:hypothetical protein
MPIKYVQTLGAVAGIVQTVNAVEITCEKPAGVTRTASGRPALVIAARRPAGVTLTATPTLKPNYGGD